MSYCFGLERGQGLSEASEINVWTRWVPSAMPLCAPTLFSRQCVHKNTKLSMYHTKLYQTIQNNMNLCPDAKPYSPDNESIKHGSGVKFFSRPFPWQSSVKVKSNNQNTQYQIERFAKYVLDDLFSRILE